MNTWQALKKIVRDQFTRPKPQPWNGKHELRDCKYIEHAAWPDDFFTGWVWQCTCGTDNWGTIPPRWPGSEEEAVEEFKKHRNVREAL